MVKRTPRDLLSSPEVATEIGFLVIYTATLEAWLVPAISTMFKDRTGATGHDILQPVDNLSAKLGIMFNIAERKKGDTLPDAILAEKADLLIAVAYRNALAHGQYGYPADEGEIHLISNVLTEGRRGKRKTTELSTEVIRSHTLAIKRFIAKISELCSRELLVAIPDSAIHKASSPGKPQRAS